MKYSFLDDYSEGAHENILNALMHTNMEQHIAYGFDEYSNEARKLIQKKFHNDNSSVFFVSGGTQANLTTISALLRTHEGVITSNIGHILGNEAGALEATGHKLISTNTNDGILKVKNLEDVLDEYSFFPHRVKPKLVYLSNASEIGTIYKKRELKLLHDFCKENELWLYMDGARMGHALSSSDNDLTLQDLSNLTDAFSIGATKNGALFGEAIVINEPKIAQDFSINMKQRGALLAKGRILGIQFLELFKDNLYFDLAKKANNLAYKLAQGFIQKGYKPHYKVQTNQIFFTLPNEKIKQLQEKFNFYIWEKVDQNNSTVRLVTSWASSEEKVDEFIKAI